MLLTGGIHLDGYADTCDALASHAPPEKKREILRDPHLGAFAAIRLCCYFVASFAIWAAMPRSGGSVLILVFCLSRTLSGLAVAWFPLAKNTGLAHTFAAAADRKRVCRILAAASGLLGAALCISGWGGLAAALAAVCVFCWYKHMTRVQFGGLSGDLAGWFLQTAELWMLSALCITQYLEGLL